MFHVRVFEKKGGGGAFYFLFFIPMAMQNRPLSPIISISDELLEEEEAFFILFYLMVLKGWLTQNLL